MNNSIYNNDHKTNYELENKALQMILQNRYSELGELAENTGISTASPNWIKYTAKSCVINF